MTATNVALDVYLPCGLHLLVINLPEGIGTQKERQHEFLWTVERGAAVLGRGYKVAKQDACSEALDCAQKIVNESQSMLRGCYEAASRDERAVF